MRIGQNKINTGVLNYHELKAACLDSEGPSQKLTLDVIETVFGKYIPNLEFTGLDFRQFYMLLQSLDFVYIHGRKTNSYLNPEEFMILLDEKLYPDIMVDNIDDILVDI